MAVNLQEFLKKQATIVKRKTVNVSSKLNLTSKKNRGSVSLRIIADKEGNPFQTIKGLYEVYETIPRKNDDGTPMLNDDGTPSVYYETTEIPYLSNYSIIPNAEQLSELNKSKLEKLTELLGRYKELLDNEYIIQEDTETNLGLKYRSCTTTFWGKVFSLTPSGKTNVLEEPGIYHCKHCSANFIRNFESLIDQQAGLRGDSAPAYFNKFINNEPGSYDGKILIASTLNDGVVGYTVTISLADGMEPYTISQEEVDECVELSTIGWNFKQFDSAKVDGLISRLEKYIAIGEQNLENDVVNEGSEEGQSVDSSAPQMSQDSSNPFSQSMTESHPISENNYNPFA